MKKTAKLIFFHIPKTSGTTFYTVIRKNYPREDIVRCYGEEAENQLDRHIKECIVNSIDTGLKKEKAVIMGHFHWSNINDHARKSYKKLTFLREPVQRWISEYLHIQRSEEERHRLIATMLPDIDSRLNHPATQNVHCRFLASIPCDTNGDNMHDVYESARHNLKNELDIVGITERFDDTLVILRGALGWRRTRYNRKNFNPHPEIATQIRQEFSKQLTEANAFDLQLYDEAVSLFNQRLSTTPAFRLRKRILSATRQLNRHPTSHRQTLITDGKKSAN